MTGYKNPPKNSRFQKGQSGNPHGRPKKDNDTGIFAMFDEPIIVKINGKNRKLPKIEAMVYRRLNDALNGDPKAFNQIIKLPFIERYFKIKESAGLPPVTFIVRGVYPGQVKDEEVEEKQVNQEEVKEEDSSQT